MNRTFFAQRDIDLQSFADVCGQTTQRSAYPCAMDVVSNVVIYAGDSVRRALEEDGTEAALKSEMASCLLRGPGVFVVRNAYVDLLVIDQVTEVFRQIAEQERVSGHGRGDHFGDNARIWNSLQKACVADPDSFIDYYGNPILRLACEAWLGPSYQITAQMNNVKPGGQAQAPHRDYHLGFQSPERIAAYPAHAQVMSQYLTLQGAVAHGDMPLETGPTLFLPFSHLYPPGYLAYQNPEFAAYFTENRVHLPLAKGDMVFFSPALFHGAGGNVSQTDRIANLLQVSSAFGRTMETINNRVMIEAVYPVLQRRKETGTISDPLIWNTVAAVADGYSFPTNLDSDPPIGGKAPQTQQEMVWQALADRLSLDALQDLLSTYEQRRQA